MKVLIAEDESIIRMDLRETLERAGHTVVGEAGDGREAVNLAEALGPDVVLLDIKMPKMTGLAAAEQITKKKNIAPCVILTAFQDADLIAKARKSGVYTFLVKPYKEAELLAALELAMARYEETRALEKELDGTRSALETRKLLERAKGILMDKHRLTEAGAFRMLQKRAMDTRRSLTEVAKEILGGEGKEKQ